MVKKICGPVAPTKVVTMSPADCAGMRYIELY